MNHKSGKFYRIRPDYLCEEEKVIVEFDGLQHYTNPLFDPTLHSMGKEWQNTPAFCCVAGIRRMAAEFKRYPQQYEVNMSHLLSEADDPLTGHSLLTALHDK